MAFIYRIVNLINGKKYVGQTKEKDPQQRWKGHQKAIKQGKGCPFLRKAVLKHGIENFKFEVIAECPDAEVNEKEKEHIQSENTLIPNGYNMLKGGQGGGFIGRTHTPEAREKIRQASLETARTMSEEKKIAIREKLSESMKIAKKCISEETRKKISEKKKEVAKSKPTTESTKLRISKSLIDYYRDVENKAESDETRRKISEGAKKRVAEGRVAKFSEEMKARHSEKMTQVRGIKLDKFDVDGNFIESYDTLQIAAKANKTSPKTIHKALKGQTKTAGGFIWKRKIETVEEENHTPL
jgi:group I intron endonuclease